MIIYQNVYLSERKGLNRERLCDIGKVYVQFVLNGGRRGDSPRASRQE